MSFPGPDYGMHSDISARSSSSGSSTDCSNSDTRMGAPTPPSPDAPKESTSVLLPNRQRIDPNGATLSDSVKKPDSFNDDLRLSTFTSSNMTWAGQQKKGIQFNIPDASPYLDHVDRAMREPFHLSDEIPLPGEVMDSLQFIQSTPVDELHHHFLG